MMQVIISEGLADEDYVARHTIGFDELRARAEEYPPDKVAAITGLDADDIRQLAREFAAGQPAAIRMGIAIERSPGGGQAARALSSLPALVGAWRHPGGGILFTPEFAFQSNGTISSGPTGCARAPAIVNQWRLGDALTGNLDPRSNRSWCTTPTRRWSRESRINPGRPGTR